MNPEELYKAMCEYVTANGWWREEPGSGWWFHDLHEEDTIGGAVEATMHAAGLDMRQEPADQAPA